MPALILIGVAGCGEDTVTPTPSPNPNVTTFDSIGVEEDSSLNSYTGMNLTNGTNTVSTSSNRDVSLDDNLNSGMDFFLQSGVFDAMLPPGYETRFFRVFGINTKAQFDTLSSVDAGSNGVLDSLDFTAENTFAAGNEYFNAPLTNYPTYCFYLAGRRPTMSKPIYGIIQPREATDSNPGNIYGFKMSFRVRINTNGDNDFRQTIITE